MITARNLVDGLLLRRTTHVVGLPDNASAALFRELDRESKLDVVSVAREGEAFAIASGLWLGGAVPVVLVQNTGLLESGDALRGTAVRMGVPLVCLVTYRGFHKISTKDGDDVMTRADVDSAAIITEPTLAAWRIPHNRYGSDADFARIGWAFESAMESARPVALLLTEATC